MADHFKNPIMDYAAAEAYRLLRTNVMFSFSDAAACHTVGVTSSLPGEGKSTTAVNLAYMLAAAGKDTLLIEGDMRRPVLAKRLSLAGRPGLSNVLVGMDSMAFAVQEHTARTGRQTVRFDVLTAGDTPRIPLSSYPPLLRPLS